MQYNQEKQESFDFQRYSLIIKRRWLVMATVSLSVFGLSAFNAFKQKPIYEAEGRLVFNKTDRVSLLTSPSLQVGELSGVTQLTNPLDTEAEIIRSYPIAEKTITNLKLSDKHGKLLEIDEFLDKLKVKTVRGTDILSISYSSSDYKEAAAVVNSVMEHYLENNIRLNQTQAMAAKKFLNKQLPEAEARVLKSEKTLRQFKEQNKIVALEQEAITGVEKLSDLSDQITQAQSNLADVQTRLQHLQRQLKLNSLSAVDTVNLSQSKGVQQLLTEYQKAENELTVATTRYTNEHPTVAHLSAKVVALKKQLEAQISENAGSQQSVTKQNLQMGELKQTLTAQLVQSDVERSALGNRIKVLQNAYILTQKRLSVLPQLQEKQQQLERQLQVARATYEELLKRSQEVDVAVNQNVGNARIVSKALVPKKVNSKIILHLALGGFLGILLAVGTTLMLEAIDKSVKTPEQIQHLLGYPLIGTIPYLGQKNKAAKEFFVKLPVRDNPYSEASSAFEMLQTSLDFTVLDKQLKVIVVVSPTPGEGRSFVAANLAVAKVHMGRKVLLIDADMRHSSQQEIWKLSNQIGLSNVLVGQTELKRTTQEVLVNLDVVTTGTIPPNPAALLDSQGMADLIQEAAKAYECIIIDTPALSLFGDALMLSKVADGILLVVRPEMLNSTAVKKTKTILKQARSPVLGMVVNGVRNDNNYTYYNHKGYYERNGSNESKNEVKFPNLN